MSENPPGRFRLLCLRLLIAFRWAALAGTLFYSLFHWMRAEYWEFGPLWQYGLVLLDPRIPAVLLWTLITALGWGCFLYPAARWLAPRLPQAGRARWLAAAAFGVALGTRGVVGSLVLRAALAAPLHVGLPGAAATPLLRVDVARWAVLLADAWWGFPLLVLFLRALPEEVTRASRSLPLLIGLLALQAPLDAPYLITGGGPHGATTNLQLLAFQEGFGRQEFGYASVLTVLLCAAALLAAELLLRRLPGSEERLTPQSPLGASVWIAVLMVELIPLLSAARRALPHFDGWRPVAWAAISLLAAGMGAAWTVWLAALLARRLTSGPDGWRLRMWLWPMLLPSLAWVLPMLRPLGYQGALLDSLVAPAALVLAAPMLYLAALAIYGLARGATPSREVLRAAGLLTAWALGTELTTPLLLQQAHHRLTMLTTGIVWDLATRLRELPTDTPGWPLLWLGGSVLAGGAAFLWLGAGRPVSAQVR